MKEPFAPGHPYLAGETVTAGAFACLRCGHVHRIEDGRVTNLPVCPVCQFDRWTAA